MTKCSRASCPCPSHSSVEELPSPKQQVMYIYYTETHNPSESVLSAFAGLKKRLDRLSNVYSRKIKKDKNQNSVVEINEENMREGKQNKCARGGDQLLSLVHDTCRRWFVSQII